MLELKARVHNKSNDLKSPLRNKMAVAKRFFQLDEANLLVCCPNVICNTLLFSGASFAAISLVERHWIFLCAGPYTSFVAPMPPMIAGKGIAKLCGTRGGVTCFHPFTKHFCSYASITLLVSIVRPSSIFQTRLK